MRQKKSRKKQANRTRLTKVEKREHIGEGKRKMPGVGRDGRGVERGTRLKP